MTRQEILQSYDVNKQGIIRKPGKFEGCMLYAPHFCDLMLDGSSDEIVYNENGKIVADVFIVTDEDKREFPELEGIVKIELCESEQGFIYCYPIE